MTIQYDDAATYYCTGWRTGIVIREVREANRGVGFAQRRAGLHPFCFRLRSREDIERLHEALVDMGAAVIRAPRPAPWAPGYHCVLREDPDRTGLEAVFRPDAGNLGIIKDRPVTAPMT